MPTEFTERQGKFRAEGPAFTGFMSGLKDTEGNTVFLMCPDPKTLGEVYAWLTAHDPEKFKDAVINEVVFFDAKKVIEVRKKKEPIENKENI